MKPTLQQIVALVGAVFVVGFVLLAFHWKAEAERQAEAAELAKQQAAAAKAAVQSLDRHAEVMNQAQRQNREEVDVLRKLPGSETPTDPERRAALCSSLSRLRHEQNACRS